MVTKIVEVSPDFQAKREQTHPIREMAILLLLLLKAKINIKLLLLVSLLNAVPWAKRFLKRACLLQQTVIWEATRMKSNWLCGLQHRGKISLGTKIRKWSKTHPTLIWMAITATMTPKSISTRRRSSPISTHSKKVTCLRWIWIKKASKLWRKWDKNR